MSAVLRIETGACREESEDLKGRYLSSLKSIERLHRLLLDVVKDEFDRLGRDDVNSVQALLLYHVGDDELTAGELSRNGCYLGSNVSYNLKKLVEAGYIDHQRSTADRRTVRVKLTDKGREVSKVVDELFQRQLRSLPHVADIGGSELDAMNKAMGRIERFWTDQIRFQL
jgi:DNA-binding MarR family transcriptional regulator